MPRAMSAADIETVIAQFRRAAANAREAGFDGVELHAANGYLLDQFLHWETNQRQDQWGGSPENMCRLLFDVIRAVKEEIPDVGVRLSPVGYLHMQPSAQDKAVFDHLLPRLNNAGLAYVHTGIFEDVHQPVLGDTVTGYIRGHYWGKVIASGGYDATTARQILEKGTADMVAFGRALVANPDYAVLLRVDQPARAYDESLLETLY